MAKNLLLSVVVIFSLLSAFSWSATGVPLTPKMDSIQIVFDDQQLVLHGESFRITVIKELMPSKGKYINIKAYSRKQPELAKELLLPLNYETKIEYRPTAGFDKAPGSQIKGELLTEFNNGQTRICSDLRNSLESTNFQFSGVGGLWKNGKFTIEPDFTRIEEHRAALIVNSLHNKSAADTFSVLLDYKHAYQLNL